MAGMRAFAFFLAFALSACGGGGGGSNPPKTNVDPQGGAQGSEVAVPPATPPVASSPATPAPEPNPTPPVNPTPALTWSKVLDTGFKSALRGIDFLDAQTGYVYGSMPNGALTAGVLQLTTDGGAHWSAIAPPDSRGLNSAVFVSPNIGWAGGLSTGGIFDAPHAYLFRTTDGGNSWEERRLPTCSASFGGYTVYRLQFVDEQQGWVSGTCGLMRTSDGGQTWNLVSSRVSPADFLFVNELVAWSSGGTSVSRSVDGGVIWQTFEFRTLFPESEYGLTLTGVNKAVYLSEQLAWVAMGRTSSSKDALFRTRDGGVSWQALSLPTYVRVAGLQFVSADRGWLLSSVGVLYRTEDGGSTWGEVSTTGGALWSMSKLVVIGDQESVFSISYGNPSTMPSPFEVWSSVWRARLP